MRTLCVAALVLACGTDHKTRAPGSCDGPCPASKIDHVVIIVQENHTFDSYFGTYCTGATGSAFGSALSCTTGAACCEAGPGSDPTGASPIVLDDTENGAYDPNHTQACELVEADGGKMDKYVTGGPGGCSDPRNFAYASTAAAPYHQLAMQGALADRYFQPVSGQSSSNEMYLATAKFVFLDDSEKPAGAGSQCSINETAVTLTGTTIGDLLDAAKVSWTFYAEGYDAVVATPTSCPAPGSDCPAQIPLYPCVFDSGDMPFDYYQQYTDNPRVLRDLSKLQTDLDNLTLPQVVYVKGLGFRTEHPGLLTNISDGAAFVNKVAQQIADSQYAPDTLLLVTWDEGGGFFDHVAPPGSGADGEPYGTRIPLLALGPFAATNTISHVQMEHSSIITFIEWNWLDMKVGGLNARDAVVNNIGSMLDATKTGVTVP